MPMNAERKAFLNAQLDEIAESLVYLAKNRGREPSLVELIAHIEKMPERPVALLGLLNMTRMIIGKAEESGSTDFDDASYVEVARSLIDVVADREKNLN